MEKKVFTKSLETSISREIWSSIASDAAIKTWASDLTRLTKLPYAFDDWPLVGQGVVIESNEEADARDLIHQVAFESGMEFHILESNHVMESLHDCIESFIGGVPTILYLVPGVWQGEKYFEKNPIVQRFPYDEEQCRQFRNALITLLNEKLAGELIVLVTAVSSIAQMDSSLRCAGLFDRRIQMPRISDQGLFNAFVKEIGQENCGSTILEQSQKVACLLRHEYSKRKRRLLMQKAMKRLAWREGRLLTFEDMIRFSCYGTADVDAICQDTDQKRRNAIHEAGHAVVSHLTSRKKMPPDFCSITARNGCHGIVVAAIDSYERTCDDPAWKDLVHQLKVLLAGRAAEHLILGAEEISARGSNSDLEKATQMVCSMFGVWGLPDDLSSDSTAGANLVVVITEVSISEAERVETMARRFIQKMFLETFTILKENRTYLNALVDALCEKNFLIQADLQVLYDSISDS